MVDFEALHAHIYSLMAGGRHDEARARIAAALETHPGDSNLLRQSAQLAGREGDWVRAVELYRKVSSSDPGNPYVGPEIRFAQAQMRLMLAARKGLEIATVQVRPPGPAPDVRGIVEQFESLGDNCEFGLVQRRFEAEPLGLLRWSGTEPEQIIAAVAARFDGVGERQNLCISSWENGEYKVSDRRYGMVSHTFIYEAAFDRDSFIEQQMRRIRILKKKLLQEMVRGDKLLVYKSPDITPDQARRLCDACRDVGPSTLLVVRPADEDHAAGSVEQAAAGLLLGYLDRMPPIEDIENGLSLDCWETLMVSAYALWRLR